MEVAKAKLYTMIEHMPEDRVGVVIDFLQRLEELREEEDLREFMLHAAMSSMSFWDNPEDDELWGDNAFWDAHSIPTDV